MFSGILISIALNTAMVPPGESVEDHSHPGHYTQPTIRRFERYPVDRDRRLAWEAYCRELDILWREFREADSTPRAWRVYVEAGQDAKRRYIYGDPYLAPVFPVGRERYDFTRLYSPR